MLEPPSPGAAASASSGNIWRIASHSSAIAQSGLGTDAQIPAAVEVVIAQQYRRLRQSAQTVRLCPALKSYVGQ
jgi:hypothetical protein